MPGRDKPCLTSKRPLLRFNANTLFLSFLQLLCSSALSSSAETSDVHKLLSFKSTLPNPNILQNWQHGTDRCLFAGVFCNNNSNVISLDLSFLSLSPDFNSVSHHLFSIKQLTSLTLNSANVTGSLHPFSFCSPSLAEINLSNNFISGAFSDLSNFESCSGLKNLNLSSNLLASSKDLNVSRFDLSLETLDVSANNLSSSDQVFKWVLSGGCASLRHLSLAGNKLAGSFPRFKCPNLKYLDLSSNFFVGEIGDAFAGLRNLNYLNVSNNRLNGSFPLLPQSSLMFLYLGSNQFQGVIPESFPDEACSTLVELDLSCNNLTGMIPSGFASCSLLKTFDISNNDFFGDLPTEIFIKMSTLKKLALSFNDFAGTFPDSVVATLSNLEVLDLSSNYISGKIPLGICRSVEGGGISLKELYLQNNLLSGPIPPTLGNCSQLVSLDLSFNYLSGRIPSSLGSLSNLKDLIMWMNRLEGDIPSELMYNQELENLILDYKLTGTIPSGLRKCTNLKWISLSSNKLSGTIPSWMGGLAKLAILKLSNNLFYGQIPRELGDCKSLLWLDLNSNLLTGSIPSTLSRQSGFLPVGLVVGKKYVFLRQGRIKENCHGTVDILEFAGIRKETLVDRIRTRDTCNFTRIFRGDTQPTFSHNGSMIFLDLSFNNLEGNIPRELGSMQYLSILKLGHNNLSGPIPEELGGLRDVGVLDLSHNHLAGQIPQSLASLTFLTDVDLSNNNLSGLIPSSGQMETFPADRFCNNSGLCGYPLPACESSSSADSHATNESDDDHYFYVGLYVSIALGFYVGFCAFFGTLAVKDSWRHRYFQFVEHIVMWVYVKVAIQVAKFKRNAQTGPQ